MIISVKYHRTVLSGVYVWQTRISYAYGAYITLVNTELGFRLFKLGITRIAPLYGFCGALPCFDSIRRCAPLIRFF